MKNVLVVAILLFIIWAITLFNGCSSSTMPDIRYCYTVYMNDGQVIKFISNDSDIEISKNGIKIDSIKVREIIWNNWKCRKYDYKITWLIDSTVTPPKWEALKDSAEVYNNPKYYKFDLYTWVRKTR